MPYQWARYGFCPGDVTQHWWQPYPGDLTAGGSLLISFDSSSAQYSSMSLQVYDDDAQPVGTPLTIDTTISSVSNVLIQLTSTGAYYIVLTRNETDAPPQD
jgi:hypothetical protein